MSPAIARRMAESVEIRGTDCSAGAANAAVSHQAACFGRDHIGQLAMFPVPRRADRYKGVLRKKTRVAKLTGIRPRPVKEVGSSTEPTLPLLLDPGRLARPVNQVGS